MSEKIFPRHTQRKAMLYVRQSSPYQVMHNEESRRLQYAMQHRLEQLGFSQVDVIDEDLGRSAAGGVTRTGFEQMVAEVCLGKVGAVAAREVSRFARNSREWQQLVEVCRVVDTLLIDQEMVYDPRRGNDRLLLGLKGNPEYAGAYAYGKTQTGSHFQDGTARKMTRRRRPKDQWLALIPQHHEGYIAWDQFQRIQAMIAGNVLRTDLENPGAARRGAAVLTGLLRCRRCGRKLTVTYTGRRREVLRYACHRGHLDIGEPKCISFGGTSVDEAVGREVLRVVQPGAVEAALLAGQEQCQQQGQVLDALALDLKAARYAAQRAWKQYDAVDPENRLVADELERRWNAAMDQVRTLEHRTQKEQASQQQVTPPTPEVFQNLAADLLAVWEQPATDVRLKKRIIRTLIHEVIVDLDSAAGQVTMVIHWQGGVHTELSLPRRRRGQNSAHTDIRIVEAVRLMAKVCTDDLIANVLNRNGLLTGHKNRWTRQHVISLRSHHEIPIHSLARRKAEGWMNLTEAAALVGVSPKTLRLAAERGQIPFDHPLPDGPWIFNRRNLQGPMIDNLVQQARHKCPTSAGRSPGQLCLDLTTTWPGEAV